jgi:hypothetical protein
LLDETFIAQRGVKTSSLSFGDVIGGIFDCFLLFGDFFIEIASLELGFEEEDLLMRREVGSAIFVAENLLSFVGYQGCMYLLIVALLH